MFPAAAYGNIDEKPKHGKGARSWLSRKISAKKRNGITTP